MSNNILEEKSRRRRSPPEDKTTTRIFFALVGLSFFFILSSIFSRVNPTKLDGVQSSSAKRLSYTLRALDDRQSFAPSIVLISAHRGCHGRFPENSLGAIAACAEEGAQMAEVDARLTRDGELVLAHDETLAQMTNSRKRSDDLSQMTVAELKRFWLSESPGSGSLSSFKIPTLVEAIEVARSCGIVLVIDAKQPYLERSLFDTVERLDAWDHVVLYATKESFAVYDLWHQHNKKSKTKTPYRSILQNSSATLASLAPSHLKTRCDGNNLASEKKKSPSIEVHNFLWENGDYHLRDPKTIADILNRTNASALPLRPCPRARLHEVPCFGAPLYVPLLRTSCARVAVTDMPTALRASLLAYGMAPASGGRNPNSWPLDTPNKYTNAASQLAPHPKCLDFLAERTGRGGGSLAQYATHQQSDEQTLQEKVSRGDDIIHLASPS